MAIQKPCAPAQTALLVCHLVCSITKLHALFSWSRSIERGPSSDVNRTIIEAFAPAHCIGAMRRCCTVEFSRMA